MNLIKQLLGLTEEQKAEREEQLAYLKKKQQIETEAYRKEMLENAPEIGRAKAEAKIEEQKKNAKEGKKKGLLAAFDDLTKAATKFDMNEIDNIGKAPAPEKKTGKNKVKDLDEFAKGL